MNEWQKWKERAKLFQESEAKPWHVLDKDKHTDESEATRRFEICKGCEFLTKTTNQCQKCGCLMHLKTKLKAATCPIGKW